MRALPFALAAAVLALPAAATAQAGSRQTREFVQAAGQSDAFEVLEANTVLTQSLDGPARDFAKQMLRDHGQTSAALARATSAAGLEPPPTQLGADQAPLLAALQGVKGPEFERTYWKQQALAHRSALTVEQGYADHGDTPGVRQAAQAAVPVIAAHLATAERMAAQSGS